MPELGNLLKCTAGIVVNTLQNGLPQLRCFGLRGNFREEINIDGVADAPSGVLKIALHRDVSPLLSACVV